MYSVPKVLVEYCPGLLFDFVFLLPDIVFGFHPIRVQTQIVNPCEKIIFSRRKIRVISSVVVKTYPGFSLSNN